MVNMIDSHAHLAFGNAFDVDRRQVIDRMKAAAVNGWIEVGTDIAQSMKALGLVEGRDDAWVSVGVHPTDIDELDETSWGEIERLLGHEKVVAVGEVGFDFYRTLVEEKDEVKIRQAEVLERFVELAERFDKPMIFHVRDTLKTFDAQEAMIDFLKGKEVKGVIHTFSGNVDHARAYLDLGLHLSFSGVVTFKNAGEIAEAAKICPADKMLIETDSPFLAPVPYRGQRNEPAYVRLVAQQLAELRRVSLEEIDQVTEANTRRLFGL